MRIAVATVMYEADWAEEAADIKDRLDLLDGILDQSADADLLVLPAGFACVRSENAARAVAAKIVDRIASRAAIAFGCDVKGPAKKSRDKRHRSGPLQNFGYLALKDGSRSIWHVRQLVATSRERVPIDERDAGRVASIAGKKVGLLICGEMMSKRGGRGFCGRRLSSIVDAADVAIDIAHADIKTGKSIRTWSAALRDLGASRRRPAIIAQHLYSDAVRNQLRSYADKDGPRRLVYALAPARDRAKVLGGDEQAVRAYVDHYDV